MRDIYIISDTHIGHDNIIKYCNRPFENSYYMNQCIRDNWNSIVKPEDKVYHLGDVYMGKNWTSGEKIEDFLKSLHGHKRLILGNHDNGKDQILQKVFEKISVWRMFREFDLLLTHVPVHPLTVGTKLNRKGQEIELVNVHGHIHNNKSPEGAYINACVEWWDYKPVHIEELAKRAKELLKSK